MALFGISLDLFALTLRIGDCDVDCRILHFIYRCYLLIKNN
jgi:hypothetical protein